MTVVYQQNPTRIEDYPRALRTGACVGGQMELTLNPHTALILARLIEDSLTQKAVIQEQVLVVEKEAPISGAAWILIAFTLTLYFFASIAPAAKFIAGLF